MGFADPIATKTKVNKMGFADPKAKAEVNKMGFADPRAKKSG